MGRGGGSRVQRNDPSERHRTLARVAAFAVERSGTGQRALELSLGNEPVSDGRQTRIGPLILPLCLDPPLKQHEFVMSILGILPALEAAIAASTIRPDSYAARVSGSGVLVLPASLADVPLIGNAALLRLWHETFVGLVTACRSAGPGHHRRLRRAFKIRLRFDASDCGALKQLMGRLGIYWRVVPADDASFMVGPTGYRVADRDYGLLQTLLMTTPLGTGGSGGMAVALDVLLGGSNKPRV